MARGKWCRPTTPTTATARAAEALGPASPTAMPPEDEIITRGRHAYFSANDEDTCCVQAFVKSVGVTAAARPSRHVENPYAPKHQFVRLRTTGSTTLVELKRDSADGGAQDAASRRAPMLGAQERDTGGAGSGSNSNNCDRSGGCHIGDSKRRVNSPTGDDHHRYRPATEGGLAGPVFYRAAWRRTGGKTFVWKISSR